ncbi:MAG: GYD domain-containing protein [Nitrososphaeria archaeon]|jgi:uncharacterized protein with GYD domain
MIFISLWKNRQKLTKEMIAESLKLGEIEKKEGIKYLGFYYTLGRYDYVAIFEAPDEKAAMKAAMRSGGIGPSETLVAVPAEEARKLVE